MEQVVKPERERPCREELPRELVAAAEHVLPYRVEEPGLLEQLAYRTLAVGLEPSIDLFADGALDEGKPSQVVESGRDELGHRRPRKPLHVLVQVLEASDEQTIEDLSLDLAEKRAPVRRREIGRAPGR